MPNEVVTVTVFRKEQDGSYMVYMVSNKEQEGYCTGTRHATQGEAKTEAFELLDKMRQET